MRLVHFSTQASNLDNCMEGHTAYCGRVQAGWRPEGEGLAHSAEQPSSQDPIHRVYPIENMFDSYQLAQ